MATAPINKSASLTKKAAWNSHTKSLLAPDMKTRIIIKSINTTCASTGKREYSPSRSTNRSCHNTGVTKQCTKEWAYAALCFLLLRDEMTSHTMGAGIWGSSVKRVHTKWTTILAYPTSAIAVPFSASAVQSMVLTVSGPCLVKTAHAKRAHAFSNAQRVRGTIWPNLVSLWTTSSYDKFLLEVFP